MLETESEPHADSGYGPDRPHHPPHPIPSPAEPDPLDQLCQALSTTHVAPDGSLTAFWPTPYQSHFFAWKRGPKAQLSTPFSPPQPHLTTAPSPSGLHPPTASTTTSTTPTTTSAASPTRRSQPSPSEKAIVL